MEKKQVLLVGETWVSAATHYKGFDQFGSVTFHSGAEPLIAALKDSDFALTHMPAHEAVEALPFTLEGLARYDAVILSDVGANSLLLHPDVWLHGKPVPNRLKLLREWTAAGGGLVMIGGYLSFQGIDGRARWRGTPVEQALPVACLPTDDRIEIPEGFAAEILQPTHPILAGLDGPWPLLLGANEVTLKDGPGVEVLARLPAEEGGHPLLVTGHHGKGRTLAWTSDIGPHWLPPPFVAWHGYARLWRNVLGWVTGG
ncbi:glutamine amidotransferase [Labrys wisconsinensis]|uniref:Membrane protein n=1 Tax=Labrys wisconsinensis TaxID=425677 RepID=A0ABU0J132_9HYPH|nr:glutamine amidotransferase [Labrys wisconsinensis]MDQ0467009.1 putative membrane protein [Labrys wisconsinensis]